MHSIVVVNNPKDFAFEIEGVEILAARSYLTESKYAEIRNVRIYNLCKSYRYQSIGYYVSLLAEARGHRVFPNITTIQDIKSQTIMRIISDDIDVLVQHDLAKIKSKTFDLSIYFGKNVAKHYDNLSKQLFNLFQAPLLRATFIHNKKWVLQNINPIPINEIPEKHRPYIIEFATQYFAKKRIRTIKKDNHIYDLAILVSSKEDKSAPSDKKALQKFVNAAESIGFSTEFITKDDFSRVPEFDAIFIRETTSVNHHTYRFARRAHAEGLVVIDDPISIVKCTNKVYLNELLAKAKLAAPKTLVVHKYNIDSIDEQLGFPCVLKQPDSSSSLGVVKVKNKQELTRELEELFSHSELIVAQEFTPTEFDWRIGVLDRKPLFAVKYYMVKNHWQICDWNGDNKPREGKHLGVSLQDVPPQVIHAAVKAANLIGDGFYGVDLKQIGKKTLVIEINDNPSIEHGVEDAVLKDELYLTIVKSIMHRVQHSKTRKSNL